MARLKNANWHINETTPGYPGAQLAVLMDIRDELQTLNRVLSCGNLTRYESILRGIRAKLPTRHKKKLP